MSGLKLAIIFVDGLDCEFVMRNHHHSGYFGELFPLQQIHQIDGVCHSLQCLSKIFCGRNIELFEFEGHEPIPRSDKVINWDFLLSYVKDSEILWNKINRMGFRVGLMEMLGVFIPPPLDGFCVSKNTLRIGLGELHRLGLTHHPRELGPWIAQCCREHAYPLDIELHLAPHEPLLDRPLQRYGDAEIFEVITRCGYHRMFEAVEENFRRMLMVAGELQQRCPVEVMMLHTGYLDVLLHFFFGRQQEEREILYFLDRIFSYLNAILEPEQVLVFSDHGMKLSRPHQAGKVIHRTIHNPRTALLAGSGERLCGHLEAHPPADLTAVYHAALHALARPSEIPEMDLCEPPLQQVVARQQQLLAERDRLLMEFDRESELDRLRVLERLRDHHGVDFEAAAGEWHQLEGRPARREQGN